ncbi:MAG: hypothetical protein AAF466_07820 [Bacteroidota bacterium]
MKTNLLLPFIGILASVMLFSCVKDTDFSQAENVTLRPVVELDLIYFNAEAQDFFDPVTNTSILTISDTTEIRFLDDTGVQESLIRAEFLFDFTNSIPRTFQVEFVFLTEENEETYRTETTVQEGTELAPVLTQFLETVEGEDITQLTMADKVVVAVTILSSDENLTGTLNLKSKTTYYLEIRERS